MGADRNYRGGNGRWEEVLLRAQRGRAVAGCGEQQRLHPQRLGRLKGQHLPTAAHVPLVAGVTQAVSGLVDVHVPVPLTPEVAGEYKGWAGAGIWVLMARAGLCRAVYTPQSEHSDQAHPMSNRKSLGAGRVCVSPPGLNEPSQMGVDITPSPRCDSSTASSKGSIPWCKTKRTGVAWGGGAVGTGVSGRELLGWALESWEMALSSCRVHYSSLRAERMWSA